MKSSNYQIGYDALRVDSRFALTLTDNGEEADRRCWIKAAPAIDGGPSCVGIYITTNGDPVQIATLNGNSEITWFLGEDESDDSDEITIATCLDSFMEFAGLTPTECADKCADMFAAIIE